ncbi:hypothetical protein [Marinomonas sp. PE14-40]|uniref:hypothetical protein n=1 Tax=Marinomonas sp. PE14-40 TaxID=3060621 RepID=UPI003F66D557
MKSVRQINDQIKLGLEGIISQQKQQHLYHQTKLREQVVSKYLQFNACLSEQERRQIKQFIEQHA